MPLDKNFAPEGDEAVEVAEYSCDGCKYQYSSCPRAAIGARMPSMEMCDPAARPDKTLVIFVSKPESESFDDIVLQEPEDPGLFAKIRALKKKLMPNS